MNRAGSDESPESPRREPRGFPLRVHIAGLFIGLILIAGLVVVGYGYIATSRLLLSAGDEEFAHVADRTAGHVRELLSPARLLIQLLSRHRITETTSLTARLESVPLLTAALTDHPEISAVYAGFANGDFFLVRTLRHPLVRESLGAPPDAAFLVQSRTPGAGAASGRFIFFDASLRVLRADQKPDYLFDPRSRDWYLEALANPAPVRTSPYVFFTTREVGTTLAQRSTNGSGVVGVDITLQDLSRGLARSRVTKSTRMALVDGRGIVVALSDAERVVRFAPAGEPAVARLEDLNDPVLGPLFTSPIEAGSRIPLRLDHQKWLGMKRPIAADAGDPLMLLVAAPRAELVAEAKDLVERQLLIGLVVIGLTLALVWWSARRLSRPLEILSGLVREIGRGRLDTPLPDISNPSEVANLVDVTDRMRRELKDHIAEHALRLADEHRRARELEIARHIQQSMLPSPLHERVDGQFAIAAELQPAREVGGDLYDFFMQDGQRLVFAIADVADKGVPAALLMARVTGLLRAVGRGDISPDRILRELDTRLGVGNDTCTFVTAGCGQLDAGTGELWYASAGHDSPLLRWADGVTAVLGVKGGPALGLELSNEFPLWKGCLAPGDTIVLCTDGVTEAFDADGTAFGLERLRQVVAETPVDAMDTLPDRLAKAVAQFSIGGGPRDDLAVLAVQYRSREVDVDRGGEGWRLSIASAPDDLARAQRQVEGILRARQVPELTIHDCSVATEEVLTNIAKHAYVGDARGSIRIEVRVRPEEIRLRFHDMGPPFNPLEARAPHADLPLAARPLGGHGIVLVKGLADACEYSREGQWNVLMLSWAKPAPPAEETVPELTELTNQSTRGGAMALNITITSPKPGTRRVTLEGRLDTLTAPKLDEEVAVVLDAPDVKSIVFELRGLDYISSAGIRCLIRARKTVTARGGEVAVVNAQPGVHKVFEIVKALPSEQIFANDAELDAYLDAMQRKTR